MLVQLADGRSFGFPDGMDDAQVDRFIQALLAAEKSAADAQRRVADLHAVVSAQKPQDHSDVIAAIGDMQKALEVALARVERIAGADRMIVHDEFGTPRSRITL